MTLVMFERNRLLVNGLRTFWTAVALWYELGIFFNAVRNCPWPDSSLLPVRFVHSGRAFDISSLERLHGS